MCRPGCRPCRRRSYGVQLAEAPDQQDSLMLIIDVGTNAEMALGNREQLLCASSPPARPSRARRSPTASAPPRAPSSGCASTGPRWQPSFKVIGHPDWIEPGDDIPDSARANGICGSGIIEADRRARSWPALSTPDGRFDETAASASSASASPGRHGRVRAGARPQTATGKAIVVTQTDVRAIQLAKARCTPGPSCSWHTLGVHRRRPGRAGRRVRQLHRPDSRDGPGPDPRLRPEPAWWRWATPPATARGSPCSTRASVSRPAGWPTWNRHVQTAVDPSFQTNSWRPGHAARKSMPFPHLAGLLPVRPCPGRAPANAAAARRSRARRPVRRGPLSGSIGPDGRRGFTIERRT